MISQATSIYYVKYENDLISIVILTVSDVGWYISVLCSNFKPLQSLKQKLIFLVFTTFMCLWVDS